MTPIRGRTTIYANDDSMTVNLNLFHLLATTLKDRYVFVQRKK